MTTAEFVDCKTLPPGSRLDVETKNRHYQIECLGGDSIRISGHPLICPNPVPGKVEGSADKTGVVEPGLISSGLYLRVRLDDERPIITSRVLSIHVEPPKPSDSAHSPWSRVLQSKNAGLYPPDNWSDPGPQSREPDRARNAITRLNGADRPIQDR